MIVFLLILVAFLTITSPAVLAARTTTPLTDRPRLRYPPPPLITNNNNRTTTLDSSLDSSWPPPKPSDLLGTYLITHSSRLSYQALTNLRADHYPVIPSTPLFPIGSVTDLVSWSSSADNVTDLGVTTVFGWFVPLPHEVGELAVGPVASWRYSSTGPLVNTTNLYAVLGVGVDVEGYGYRVDYETGYTAPGADEASNADPCVNVASRRVGGPDEGTLCAIVEGLKTLGDVYGDQGFVRVVDGLKALKVDGRRAVDDMVECDEACVGNEDLVPV